jgi:hypothetical protein
LIKWRVEGIGMIAFEGIAFDRRVVIAYFCPKGELFTGNYFFPVEEMAAALASYEAVHKQLSAIYGAPWLDNTPWMQPAVDPRWLQSDSRYYSTTWDTSRIKVTTMLMPSQADERPGWRIAIVVGRAHYEERSNKSLERTRER